MTETITTNPSFVQRVKDIPVVSDAIQKGYSIVTSNTYSAKAYGTAEGLATHVYKTTEPIQAKFQPQIQQIDGALNKGLDYVKDRYPYPFEVKTDEIVAKARAPADQAFAVYSDYANGVQSRLSPIAEQIQFRLSKTLETIRPLQEKLQTNLAALSGPPTQAAHAVTERVHNASNSIVAEVEGLLNYLKTQSQEVPPSLQPLVDRLSNSYTTAKAEISKSDVPITEKASNILNLTKDNVAPLIQEAIQAIRDLVSKKADQASDKYEEGKDKLGDVKATGEQKVSELQDQGSKKAGELQDQGSKKAGELQDKGSKKAGELQNKGSKKVDEAIGKVNGN